jgi:serine/threonine protein kinase
MIEAGTLLQQRYRIGKHIGQGGMGAVYVATDERFGSTVAIKETLCMDGNFRKAIEREARLLNSLKHPALPRVTDHFEESNSQFLVMEYIPGEDLSTIIEHDKKPFEVAKVLDWADQLLDALNFLHTQETPVVHRDIKPQNLKLTPEGRVVLLDFGLAKGNPTDASHQTAAKSIFGYSRNYASVEQIQGTGTDPRSDLYSLSATLYHLLTGVPPEDALTRAMSVLSRKADPLAPANMVNPAVPAGVAGVLQKTMGLDAAGRPGSAAIMRQMLRDYQKYGYLADVEPAIELPQAVDPSSGTSVVQPANLTGAAAISPSELKTEVLPGNLSQVTSVRPTNGADVAGQAASQPRAFAAAAAPRSRRPMALAAAGVVAVLLIGGVLAGGIYKFVGFTDKTEASKENGVGGDTAPISEGGSQVASDGSQSSGTENIPAGPDRSKQTGVPERAPETSRGVRPPEPPKTNADVPGPVFDVPPTDDGPGQTVFTRRNPDGSTTTTTYPTNPNRSGNPKRPNVRVNPRDGFPPFNTDNLPPAVKRKINEQLRRKRIPFIRIPDQDDQ